MRKMSGMNFTQFVASRKKRDATIMKLVSQGHTLRHVGVRFGISAQRVHAIVTRLKARAGK